MIVWRKANAGADYTKPGKDQYQGRGIFLLQSKWDGAAVGSAKDLFRNSIVGSHVCQA
ncbi:hypothetical protein SAMN05720354_1218 [Nitrosospira sp. Nsp1]|nr:hypothetical protein SAMN05720354_1218 [Nitrosospira sp. Nsp1]